MLSTVISYLLHAPYTSAASPPTSGAAPSGHAAGALRLPGRSILIKRYAVGADGEATRLLEQLSRLESRTRPPGGAMDAQSERRRMAIEADLRREALRNLIRTGLDASIASEGGRAARARALETLAALESTSDILAALEAAPPMLQPAIEPLPCCGPLMLARSANRLFICSLWQSHSGSCQASSRAASQRIDHGIHCFQGIGRHCVWIYSE
jgi:hypothetical protein